MKVANGKMTNTIVIKRDVVPLIKQMETQT
jgi:hypothetical protein